MTLLCTERLTKNYGSFRALDALDLELAPGEIFGLLGPNGSGKSTALRMLLGFLQPTSGRAWIGGHDCWRDSLQARRLVGYLPGELRLYENMTGRQLLHFLLQLRGQTPGQDLDRLAGVFDIDISRPLSQLSSGMKRKIALLQVLVPKHPLVILDEPTNTLDPTMRAQLLAQLVEAKGRGQAVLFSSHVLAEVEQICDRVGILHKGRLVHLQKLSALSEIRRVRARLAQGSEAFPPLQGMDQFERVKSSIAFHYSGPIPDLLAWLRQQEVEDLRIEPLGLGGIYQQFHGSET